VACCNVEPKPAVDCKLAAGDGSNQTASIVFAKD
jgi:hypothetical protein